MRVLLFLNLLRFRERRSTRAKLSKHNGINSECRQYGVRARHRRRKKKEQNRGEKETDGGARRMRIRSNETVKTQSGLAGIVNNNDMELI